MARLDAASETRPIYPYWHQRGFPALNPPPVPVYSQQTLKPLKEMRGLVQARAQLALRPEARVAVG